MATPESRLWQSVDVLKERLIHPTLVDLLREVPDLEETMSVFEFGSGDASSVFALIYRLAASGHFVRRLAVVDKDEKILPDLAARVTMDELAKRMDIQLVQSERGLLRTFLNANPEGFDLALAQLVLHQIGDYHELSYLMYLAYRALREGGTLLMVDFHPAYLRYLKNMEPQKFQIIAESRDETVGLYTSHSGSAAIVHGRQIDNLALMFLNIGYDLVNARPIGTYPMREANPRYRILAEAGIPMFYVLQLRKNSGNCVLSTDVTVEGIVTAGSGRLGVKCLGGGYFEMPAFSGWERVKEGSRLAVQEVFMEKIQTRVVSWWVMEDDESIIGGQLVGRKKQV